MKYEAKCEVCGQGPEFGTSVYRTGNKGFNVNPHWRCEFHVPSTTQIDAEVTEIVKILEQGVD